MRVGVGLCNILTLDIHALEFAGTGCVEHVRNAKAGLGVDGDAPVLFELRSHFFARDMPVTGKLMRERAHVTGALHVILAAQRVYAHAGATDVTGRHGQVGHAHNHGRTLAVLGYPEAVIDRTVVRVAKQARGGANRLGIDPRHLCDFFGRVLFPENHRLP